MRSWIIKSFLWGLVAFVGLSPNVFAQVPDYQIRVTVDSKAKTIAALEKVTLANTSAQAINEVYFHVYPNRKFSKRELAFMMRYGGYFRVNPFPSGFESNDMQIFSIKEKDQVISFSLEGEDQTLLKVSLSKPLNPGEQTELTIDFGFKIPHAYGRLGWNENILTLSRWYPILSVLNDKGWNNHPFYPYHRPFFSESAHYAVELIVDENQTVIHTGILKNETISGEKKTLMLETPSPVREFTFTLSPDYRLKTTEVDGVKINSFYLPGCEFYADEALKDAGDLMKFYTARFGKYPYPEFNIAPVYLGYGGEQMSNMILIDTRVYQLPKKFLKRYFDFLISHETGHQWFYNILGVDEFTQMWLEEGVNSYFILEYLENKYGAHADVVELPKALSWLVPNFSFRRARDFRYQLISRTRFNSPVASKLSSYQEPSSIFSLAYGKGSRVVDMLRYVLGDDVFNRVFARMFKEYPFKNFGVTDLIKLCKEESGQDLEWFFDEWLHTAKNCDYSIRSIKDHEIVLENKGQIQMPVQVEASLADGTTEKLRWDGQGEITTLSLKSQSPIKRAFVDPYQRILEVDKINNNYPRKLFLKPVPLYLGLYDMPLFLPEDSYNLVVGPELANNGFGLKAALHKPYDWNFYSAIDYDFSEKLQRSRWGYRQDHVFHSQTTAGVEIFNVTDFEDGAEDLAGGKVYLRRELWPAAYSVATMNDHATVYLLRDRSLNQDLMNREDTRNISYLRKDEAIVGGTLHFERATPFLDPSEGYRIDTLLENSGHFLGATQYFYRGGIDTSFYRPVTPKTKVALRLKHGWGYPTDKNLYELGGWDGLRGYDRKDVRGARTALGSLEYRFPLLNGLDVRVLDNWFGLESVSGVIFADVGESWYHNWDDAKLKKDAGVGLRLTVNIGSFLEKVMVRLDAAQAIHDEEEDDTHFWFGINQAF